jgi:integrase
VIEDGRARRHRVQEFLGTVKQFTRGQALDLLNKRLASVNSVTYRPETNSTFRHFATWFMKDCKRRKRKPIKTSTLSNWQSILFNHVLGAIGDTPLADVGNTEVRDLVSSLVVKGLAAQTIKNIFLVVKLVKASAVDRDGNELYPTKWNKRFIDMPIVDENKQRKATCTGEQVGEIVKASCGRAQMATVLFAASGMRSGELFGLECRHFDGAAIKVEQELWRTQILEPKTPNSRRTIDLHPDVASLLKQFLQDRSTGYIFQTRSGKPTSPTNMLHRDIYPILERMGISKRGFHAFRRFRNTFLRNSLCPDGLLKFWMGHAGKDMSDRYDRVRENVELRRDFAKKVGVGFELPTAINWTRSKVLDAKSEEQESGEEVLNECNA